MISPYQVSPPQGNLLGSIMDFIAQSRTLQQQGATNQLLNSQANLPYNVDPFEVQKYQGEGMRQQVMGDQNARAQQQQDWQGQDRQQSQQSSAALVNGYLQNPQYAGDPMLGPLLNSGGTPTVADAVLKILGGDRTQQQGFTNQFALGEQSAGHQMDLQRLQNQGSLDVAGFNRGTQWNNPNQQRMSDEQQLMQAVGLGREHYHKTGDRSKLLAAVASIPDPAVRDTILGDAQFDNPENANARAAKAKAEAEGAAAIKAQLNSKTSPKSAVGAQDQGATFYAAPPQQPAGQWATQGVGPMLDQKSQQLQAAIKQLLGL